MRRKKAEGSSTAGNGGRITPMDVQQVEFRLAFRGYNERDVDAFLDRITEDLAAYMEENERLRAGVPVPAPVAAATAPLDDTAARAEAERIVTEAREEATRIVREAEARAAALGVGTGDTRAAVAPFLNTEREFLQSLGSLVQGHAEEVKQMVLALRSKSEAAASAAEPSTIAPPVAATTPPSPAPPPAAAPTAPATTAEEAFAPISVPAAEGEGPAGSAPEPAPVQVRRDSGDRSLRELFWGED